MISLNFQKFKYSFLETLFLNLVIFIIFFILNPVQQDFIHMNLHPLLLIAAFMSMRYGNYLGILSATICSITFISSYYLLGKDLYLFFTDFSHYKFLLMFYLAAILLGRFKDNYDYKLQDKEEKYKDLKGRFDKLEQNYEKTKFIKEKLKEQIIGTEESILSLYEIASSLETLDPEEIYTEVMEVLAKFLKAEVVSIYVLDDNYDFLRLKLRMGGESKLKKSIDLKETSHLKPVIKDKKVIKKDKKKYGSQFPLLSAPIMNEGEVIGLINIEKMDFEMITDYSYNLFEVIVDWTNKALARALTVEKQVDNEKYYKDTNIMRYEEFQNRLAEEKRRKEKYNMVYGLLKLKKGEFKLGNLDKKLNKLIRDVDIVAYDKQEDIIYLLFPATHDKFIPKIKNRILDAFDQQLEMLT